MKKEDLLTAVSNESGVPKMYAEKVLDGFYKTVIETVARGEEVKIQNFGTFHRVDRATKKVRNPRTGEDMQIPATRMPKFKPSKQFREETAGKTY